MQPEAIDDPITEDPTERLTLGAVGEELAVPGPTSQELEQFLAAARECQRRSTREDGRAAAAFLTEWYVSPVESPDPHGLAFEARKTLSQP